jgi:hypothetical protein
VSSKESVASRFLLHARLRPHRYAPFVSLGLVVNGRDTETTRFLDGLEVTQSRPAGVRPSVGLGYSYTFDFGLELSTEWSGWVLERPNPEISFGGTPIGESERAAIAKSGTKSFQRQITNKYHVFLMSAGYTFR